MNKEITSTANAWITAYSDIGPHNIMETPAHRLAFTGENSDMRSAGWTLVGEATITVRLTFNEEQMIANKVDSLREQAKKIRAEAEHNAGKLEDQIQQLLAITYVAEAA